MQSQVSEFKGHWQETSPGASAGKGAWQCCSFCREVLPVLPDAVRTRSIARHLEQFHPGRTVAEANRALFGALGCDADGRRAAQGLSNCIASCRKQEDLIRQLNRRGHAVRYVPKQAGSKQNSYWFCQRCLGWRCGSSLKAAVQAGRCEGEAARVHALTSYRCACLWKGASVARRCALASAWKLANCEGRRLARAAASVKLQHKGAQAWKRDLTQENIEPHPGPLLGRRLLFGLFFCCVVGAVLCFGQPVDKGSGGDFGKNRRHLRSALLWARAIQALLCSAERYHDFVKIRSQPRLSAEDPSGHPDVLFQTKEKFLFGDPTKWRDPRPPRL